MGNVNFNKLRKVAVLVSDEVGRLVHGLFKHYIWRYGVIPSEDDWTKQYQILVYNRDVIDKEIADGLDKELRDAGLDGVAAEQKDRWVVTYGGNDFVDKIDMIRNYMYTNPGKDLRRPLLDHFDYGIVFTKKDQKEFMYEVWDVFLDEYPDMRSDEILDNYKMVYKWMGMYFDKALKRAGVDWVVFELEDGDWEILRRGNDVVMKLEPFLTSLLKWS
jgi:hypothetical protein